jgi:hypothetical protein
LSYVNLRNKRVFAALHALHQITFVSEKRLIWHVTTRSDRTCYHVQLRKTEVLAAQTLSKVLITTNPSKYNRFQLLGTIPGRWAFCQDSAVTDLTHFEFDGSDQCGQCRLW